MTRQDVFNRFKADVVLNEFLRLFVRKKCSWKVFSLLLTKLLN